MTEADSVSRFNRKKDALPSTNMEVAQGPLEDCFPLLAGARGFPLP